MFAFLAPMPSELRPLVRALGLRPAAPGGYHEGEHDGVPVVAAGTGIGTAAAAAATERVLERYPAVEHVVVVGVAGGVGPSVAVGDLVVPECVLDAASGREYGPSALGPVAPRGTLRTSDEFGVDAAARAALVAAGVVAVDMETAAIAEVSERRGRRWSVFRAISDRVEDSDDAWALTLVRPDGSPDPAGVARLLLRRPWYLPRLARLGRDATGAARRAARAAAAALDGR